MRLLVAASMAAGPRLGRGRGPDDADAGEAVVGAGLESEFIVCIYCDDTVDFA